MDIEEKGKPSQPFKFLKMKYLILSSFFSLSIIIVQAQNKTSEGEYYTHAVGVKIFDGGGISYKQFLNGNNAAEVIGYFYTKGFRLAALYEVHNDIQGIGGLKWYY